MKEALLIIDPQNDFVNQNGTLYVPGAEQDAVVLQNFIETKNQDLNYIAITLDGHHVNDISHPNFWKTATGETPKPFTNITLEDVEKGIYTPLFFAEQTKTYLASLEKQEGLKHCIWPEHCLLGSAGAAIYDPLFETISNWSRTTGNFYQTFTKGTNPLTEHFGAIKANVELSNYPETQTNEYLLTQLDKNDVIYVAGQAKTHCVAYTIKQIMEQKYFPDLIKKVVVLENTMSNIPGFESFSNPIYSKAYTKGAKQAFFINNEILFNQID